MSEETRRHLKPEETRPGIMYGSCRVHKKYVDGCPTFGPLLSFLQSPTYRLEKYLVPILDPLTTNKYVVKNSLNFTTEILEQDSSDFKKSLDIDSLFTNITLEEATEVCTNNLFKNNDIVYGLQKS